MNSYYRTQEEFEALLAQLHKVQEELESYYRQLQKEQQDHQQTRLALEQQHSKTIKALMVKLDLANSRAHAAEHTSLKLQQELDAIRSSALWKTAKPIRALKKLVQPVKTSNQNLAQEIALLRTSTLFDAQWYLQHYPDVASANIDPAEHYLLYGAAEGRQPSPDFDANWYLEQNPDVANAGLNPLLHFIMFGQNEGRAGHC